MPRFIDYDQITDMIGWLGPTAQYGFITKLAFKDRDGNRDSFHKEYTYKTGVYNDVDSVSSIKRSFDYYMVIEGTKDRSIYIQIRQQNMIMLQSIIGEISRCLYDTNMWAIKNKTLIIKGNPQPLVMQNLPMGKWMSFELIVMEYNGEFNKGVRICLSDESVYTDVGIDQFMGFAYYVNTLNMYMVALEHLNYIQRPPFGTNIVIFDDPPKKYNGYNNAPGEGSVEGKSNRTIETPKQQRSFFSKINKVSE